MTRRATSTSAFGVSRRESHDASGFYRRFTPPVVDRTAPVAPAGRDVDRILVGDSRRMDELTDSSVALVVTSPPYFVGKEYEEALGHGSVPRTYLSFLDLLRDVFAECARKLEPGGRIAVNVANLGRRPYRSLSADVTAILQDDLGLLLRGEVLWLKQRGSSGSCAWGSFQSAANPVLRDLTERVIIASKGRFDRAMSTAERARAGLPHESTMTREAFMENTLDVWEIPPESATRVGHPAPFPVELPRRLIEMYTYRGDLVLDPFSGAGSTALAAKRSGRHFAGYDLDPAYVELAEVRLGEPSPAPPAAAGPLAALVAEGRSARDLAGRLLAEAGMAEARPGRKVAGVGPDLVAVDGAGRTWSFLLAGGHTGAGQTSFRADDAWKVAGRAAVLGGLIILLRCGPMASGPAAVLDAITGEGRPVAAVIDLLDPAAAEGLRRLSSGRGAVAGATRP